MTQAGFTLYLMRHAPSSHNLAKQNWKKAHFNNPRFKEAPEYARLKFSQELIDPRVVAHSCIEDAHKTMDLTRTMIIICSPLRRCLETCLHLLNSHGKMVKVIVQPLLISRLDSAWSIGSSIKVLKEEYPLFDFSAFTGIEETWMLKMLEKSRKIDSKEAEQNAHRIKNFMLEALSSGKGENYHEFRERVGNLKTRIRSILEENISCAVEKPNAVIISHSCVLNFLTGREFTEKGKVKQKVGFEHCSPKQFSSEFCLHPFQTQPHKAKL